MGQGDQTIDDLFRSNASERPEAPALISAERALSNAQLLEAIDQLAAGLVTRGVATGDRVAILGLNSIEYFQLIGACARVGAIVCPISWRLSAEEIGYLIGFVAPQLLAVGRSHVEILDSPRAGDAPLRLVLGESAPQGALALPDLMAPTDADLPDLSSEHPFCILFTAAVAGVPRGVQLTHGNLLAAGDLVIGALGLSPNDRHLAALPLFHITGLGLSLATALAGGANVIFEAFDPGVSAAAIDEHSVTILADFPPILERLLEARQETGGGWESLRYVVGLDSPETIQRLLQETGAQFWTGFGQAETTGLVTFGSVQEKPGSAGRPLPGLQVRCVDEDDRDVPVGEGGEIIVRGPVVMAGYWGDPGATEFASRGGWHHTGDVGKFDEDGYLYYLGRKPEKELIKTGGENVYPEEVERVIRELPEVAAVCVFGVPDETWGEAVKAVIELAPGALLTDEAVQEAVAARIASFKKPRVVEFVESLPRAEDGTIDRDAVKAAQGSR